MKPISNDKRANIIAAKERGEPVTKIIEWFNICRSSVERIWNKYKKTGTYEPTPFPGKQSTITEEMETKICEKVAKQPDITLEEIIKDLNINLTISGLSLHMKKMGLTLKKRLFMQQDYKEKMLSLEEQNLKKNKKT